MGRRVALTCSPVSVVRFRHVTGISSPYFHAESARVPLIAAKNRQIAESEDRPIAPVGGTRSGFGFVGVLKGYCKHRRY